VLLLLVAVQVLDDTKGPITRKEYELMQVRCRGQQWQRQHVAGTDEQS
jgi:hypothetical protein